MPETPIVRVVMAMSAVMAIGIISTMPVAGMFWAAAMVACAAVMAATLVTHAVVSAVVSTVMAAAMGAGVGR